MTKIVKEYIEVKIKEGAQPKTAALRSELDAISKATPSQDDIDKAVYGSAEYKALEAFIRKFAKAHHATVRSTVYRSSRLMDTEFKMDFEPVNNARKALEDFIAKVNDAVRDAIVAMELSKSKEDVDQLIAKAVAGLV